MNGTEPLSLEEIEESEPSSVILVLVTMAGRMANVVGIIKLFKVFFKQITIFLLCLFFIRSGSGDIHV